MPDQPDQPAPTQGIPWLWLLFIKMVDRFDWPVAFGANMPIDMLGIPGFPTLILFDTRGQAVWSGHGTDGLEEAIEEAVER